MRLYSSVLDAENGANARCFDNRWGGSEGFAPLPFPEGWPVSGGSGGSGVGSHTVALLPHVHGTDGFYIARWTRVW
jgi:16S rRNA C967 or C1407 C5-methylase (RsmB/RsmF family)